MSTPTWTDEHSRLVTISAPEVPPATSQQLDRAWARVQADLAVSELPRRRRTRAVVSAGIAAATLTIGGVAMASVFSAHTGRYPVDAEDLRLGGPGEKLDPAAPDYGTVIDEVTGDIPFPSEGARGISRQNEVKDGRREVPGASSVSIGALRFWTARAAVCAWANEWAAATAERDPSAKALAARRLEAAPSWPAVTDVDPKQTIRYRWIESTDLETGQDTSSRVADNTEAGYFPLVRRAALADDRAAMGSVLAHWGACAPALMPDFPQALPQD